jgi:hypothetical protein
VAVCGIVHRPGSENRHMRPCWEHTAPPCAGSSLLMWGVLSICHTLGHWCPTLSDVFWGGWCVPCELLGPQQGLQQCSS